MTLALSQPKSSIELKSNTVNRSCQLKCSNKFFGIQIECQQNRIVCMINNLPVSSNLKFSNKNFRKSIRKKSESQNQNRKIKIAKANDSQR